MKASTVAYEASARALGKKSAKGKQVLAIRKQLNKSPGGSASPEGRADTF